MALATEGLRFCAEMRIPSGAEAQLHTRRRAPPNLLLVGWESRLWCDGNPHPSKTGSGGTPTVWTTQATIPVERVATRQRF